MRENENPMTRESGAKRDVPEQHEDSDHMIHQTDPRIAALIDRNLKLVYSDLAREELPDRFKDLLAVLKAQDASAGRKR